MISRTGKYFRSQDNVYDLGSGEEFAPLIDRVNNEQVSAENVIILLMTHSYYRKPPSEIVDIQFQGTGKAYAFRDGNVYDLQWNIPTVGSMITLTFPDGSSYPFKPGKTWFQVVGQYSTVSEPETGFLALRFSNALIAKLKIKFSQKGRDKTRPYNSVGLSYQEFEYDQNGFYLHK